MKICHYCQERIAKGEKKKSFLSRMKNLETGKTMQFLDDMHFHIGCYTELLETRKRLEAGLAARKAKVTYQ